MKILLVGGLGYVGGRLANYLQQIGGHHIALTTTRTHFPLWCKEYDVYHLDLLNEPTIRQCLETAKPDTIIHLGALQQAQCQLDQSAALRINQNGTERLLEAALQHKVQRFIYISSFQVYGDFSGEITETTPTNPRSVYAESKLKGEEVLSRYASEDINTLILRLSNAFGYPADADIAESVWTLAFNAFCRRAILDGNLTIKSNQYRDFIAMTDVLKAIEHLLFNATNQWGAGLFNVGGDQCLSIKQVAQSISSIYEKMYDKGPLTIEGPTQDQDKIFQPFKYNIERLRSTGFELTANVDDEIFGTLKFCEQNFGARRA